MTSGSDASFSTTKLKERTKSCNSVCLRSNVRIRYCAFPKTRVLDEWSESGIVIVWCQFELLGCLFVGLLADFPYLHNRPMLADIPYQLGRGSNKQVHPGCSDGNSDRRRGGLCGLRKG